MLSLTDFASVFPQIKNSGLAGYPFQQSAHASEVNLLMPGLRLPGCCSLGRQGLFVPAVAQTVGDAIEAAMAHLYSCRARISHPLSGAEGTWPYDPTGVYPE